MKYLYNKITLNFKRVDSITISKTIKLIREKNCTVLNYLLKTKFKHTYIPLLFSALLLAGCGSDIKDPYVLLQNSVHQALDNGNWKKAKNLAEAAVKLDPNNLDAKVMYAFTLDQNGEKTESIRMLREAVEKNPGNFISQLTLGRILYDMKDYEGAYDSLANAYNLKPNSIDALILYTQCSTKLLAQNTDELLNKLSKTKTYKGKPITYNEMGVYFAKTGNIRSALANLIKAYKLSSENPTIVLNLAILCDGYMQQPAKSKFFYKRFISLTNNNPAYNLQREQVNNRLKTI
jgi:tetratricopeptide (TPR) repeat protein